VTETRPESGVLTRSLAQAPSPSDGQPDDAHRQLIGWIGLVLPLLLILFACVRDGWARFKSLESVSAYYYTGAAGLFLGMLFALALFLASYRGYPNNKHNWADRWAARLAAGSALVVAFFPTKAPDDMAPLAWWKPVTGVLHHVGAVVLFAMFAVFALCLFRLGDPDKPPAADKTLRNHIYLGCGVTILLCMAWAGFNAFKGDPIFRPEAIALVAFAVSWLVKGYGHLTIANIAKNPRVLLRS